jgi:hypothetical protein
VKERAVEVGGLTGLVSRARAALLWTLGLIVVAHVSFFALLEHRHPEWYDAEYGTRRRASSNRWREEPDRPLLLVMGSSRLVLAFSPRELSELDTADGRRVLPFNFTHIGGGPVFTLMQYHRLRRAGVHPDWLVAEILPPALCGESTHFVTEFMTTADLPVLSRYLTPTSLASCFVRTHLAPWHRQRHRALERLDPELVSDKDRQSTEDPYDALGGPKPSICYERKPEIVERAEAVARSQYSDMVRHFTIVPEADRAVRELLKLAQADGTRVVLLLTPESTTFRSWYADDADKRLTAWTETISRSYGVPVIDGRRWLDDEEFIDGHHVTAHGAVLFTRRLEAEVLRPLVAQP